MDEVFSFMRESKKAFLNRLTIPFCTLSAALVISSPSNLSAQKIIINEVLASNASFLADEDDEHDDWIELFNPDGMPVDLAGMYLSDNLSNKNKWQFPAGEPELTVIEPGGFMIIWCDNDVHHNDEDGEQEDLNYTGEFSEEERVPQLHATFKINDKRESLYLVDKNGKTIIDSVLLPNQYLDFSFGRIDQGAEWSYFTESTPLGRNVGSVKITQACPQPVFSVKPGFYKEDIQVSINIEPGYEVYYSTDGSEPHSGKSVKYSDPLLVSKTTVLRARAFREGHLPGGVASATYFINESTTLPVVSIITNSANLWNQSQGIYANPYKNYEVPAHFEFFPTADTAVLGELVGFKIFGNTSRNSSKQSFVVEATDKFGKSRLKYPFFSGKPQIKSFDGLNLRGDATSGRGGGDRETAGERVKNELIYHFNKEAGGHVDIQAYQPVTLFINGAYWGLYNLMERKGIDFIKNNYGISDIDMLNSYHLHVIAGDDKHWQMILDYIKLKNIEQDELFKKLESWLDLESIMDYWIFEIYTATHDYRVNNRMWKPRAPDGKWRMIAYDEDSWGKYDEPTVDELTSETYAESVFILGALLENKSFRNRFVNRFADLLNTVLSPQNVNRLIVEIQDVIKNEKQRDHDRWKNLVNFVEPGSQIAFLNEFAEKRPDHLRGDIIDRFELSGISTLTLDCAGKGRIHINTVQPASFPWLGVYFQDVPVKLVAVPDKGHRFTGWSDENLPATDTIIIPLTNSSYKITAKFE